jgi:hypothetical protein
MVNNGTEKKAKEKYKLEAKTRIAVATVKANEKKPMIVDARLIGGRVDCVDNVTPILTARRHVLDGSRCSNVLAGGAILARRSLVTYLQLLIHNNPDREDMYQDE